MPFPSNFNLVATPDEMAEQYHYYMTEMWREGRSTDFAVQLAQLNDIKYSNRSQRGDFPRLVAHYRPLWRTRQYGDEFGDALRPSQVLAAAEVCALPPGRSCARGGALRRGRGKREGPTSKRREPNEKAKEEEKEKEGEAQEDIGYLDEYDPAALIRSVGKEARPGRRSFFI
eukprot:GHVT01006063.1.p1 GENE.GHVT01006063.1~~GHVT01006063.1.p1  ORF type:complete len:172 (+),score=47.39 GHVT01006063.1:1009-1524(+)